MAYEPAATVRLDFDPVPRVELVFSSVPVEAETATVVRLVNGKTSRVRGAVNVFAAGGFATVDTETPFLVDVEYRAELFDAAGETLGFTDGTTVFLDLDITCFHNPLDPSTGVQVDPLPSFAAELSQPFMGDVVRPAGSSKPVLVSFGRTAVSGVNLDVATDTTEQAEAFAGLFQSGDIPSLPIVCVRTHPRWRLPLPFFAAVLDPREARFDVQFGGEIRYWYLSADEVRAPAEALSAPVLSYLDLEVSYANYSDMEAAYATYLAAESDFTLAGVSG
jgi:hypothetical protein